MSPCLASLDHLVLTVTDLSRSIAFYRDILGMKAVAFGDAENPRWALNFGAQKINLHVHGQEFDPKALRPSPGSADLCFLTECPLADWQAHFARHDIVIEEGPVPRTGATGPIISLYLRDPDGNLIEISQKQAV